MSQQLKEFVKQSGVEVNSTPSSVSTTASNNALVREIEADMGFPTRLEKNIIDNANYGEFAQFVNVSNSDNNINNIITAAVPPPSIAFKVSKLNPGMFNATVNKNFSSETRIDIKKILLKTPLQKTPIGEGLYIDTKEINGIYGRFTTGFSHTREYGKKGDINKKFFTVQIKVVISDGVESKGATVNFYRNGKIRFSGGFIGANIANQPELIRRFMVDTYSAREAFLYSPFEYNNLSGQFRVNGIFNNMETLPIKLLRQYGASYVEYNIERSPFMYITYKGYKYILSKSGNIQISGASTPANMLSAYADGSQLAKVLYEKGEITLTASVPNRLVKGKSLRIPKSKVILSTKQRAALKIDGKQCMRMPKPELIDLAKKMGVVGITTSTKKEEICDKIKKMSGTKTATFRNTNKNKNVNLSGAGNTFKVGRATCTGYSKTELLRVAGILKIKLDSKETKATLCKKIEKVRNAMTAPKPKPKTPPTRKEVAKQKEVAKVQQVIKKRGLNENSIRRDLVKLYGTRWMNRYKNVMPSLDNDVKAVKAKINQLNKGNKLGLPFKKNVNAIKKDAVSNWKMERKRELEKKVIRNQLNVNNIPRNLVTQYRNAATNYIITKAPTLKQLQNYKKNWLNTRKNKSPSRIMAKARVEKM
jgi:hypothetical protein